VWRRHFGRRYPAMALIGVSALFEPEAQVELMGVAVIDG
jgi:enamine deaminase RidA (YjgF/YER057c/UK114 family)